MRKGEIIQVGNITIAHRIKPEAIGNQVWSKEKGDWVLPDPEQNLSDEIIVKCPNSDKSMCDPLGAY